MGQRGPKPAANPGKSVGVFLSYESVLRLEDVSFTRNRTPSFIAAEAIRLGLPLVERLYPAVRASKSRAAKKKAASKK